MKKAKYETKIQKTSGSLMTTIPSTARDFFDLKKGDILIWEIDASSFDNVKKYPIKVRNILQSYARNISTLAKNTTMLKDINNDFGKIGKTTYYQYINALKGLFVIEDVPPWSPNIRSKRPLKSL